MEDVCLINLVDNTCHFVWHFLNVKGNRKPPWSLQGNRSVKQRGGFCASWQHDADVGMSPVSASQAGGHLADKELAGCLAMRGELKTVWPENKRGYQEFEVSAPAQAVLWVVGPSCVKGRSSNFSGRPLTAVV